jgi:hypothetical protein
LHLLTYFVGRVCDDRGRPIDQMGHSGRDSVHCFSIDLLLQLLNPSLITLSAHESFLAWNASITKG